MVLEQCAKGNLIEQIAVFEFPRHDNRCPVHLLDARDELLCTAFANRIFDVKRSPRRGDGFVAVGRCDKRFSLYGLEYGAPIVGIVGHPELHWLAVGQLYGNAKITGRESSDRALRVRSFPGFHGASLDSAQSGESVF